MRLFLPALARSGLTEPLTRLPLRGQYRSRTCFPSTRERGRYHSPMRLAAFLVLFFSLNAKGEIAVTDDYGNRVALPSPATRIVSLSPHLTELAYAAGAGARVVGAVEYSDFPAAARALPSVGADGAINIEAVLALRPDLVVAWPNPGSVKTIDRLAELGLPMFRSEPRELEDVATTLERLGVLAGSTPEAQRSAKAFRARRAELEKRYAARAPVRVFYQVWDRPLVTVNGDHVISKVIRLCGGENVFAKAPRIAPEIDPEALLRARPEIIIAGRPGQRPPAGLGATPFQLIPAELLQRHTPRLLDGAEQLCRALEKVRSARS